MSVRILLEGMDFSGKTTLAQGLVRRFQEQGTSAWSSQNSLCPDNPICRIAERIAEESRRHPYEASALFMAAHLWDMRHYQTDRPGVHVQDSCWLRSKAFDRRQGVPLPWDHVPGVEFSAVLYLSASLKVRQWRCRKRSPHGADHWVFTKSDQFLAMEHHLRAEFAQHPGFLEIDTSQLTSEQVLEAAWGLLQANSATNRLELVTTVG